MISQSGPDRIWSAEKPYVCPDFLDLSISPRLAMRAATQPAEIDDYGDQKPQEIDSRRRHAAVQFPGIDDGGERQKDEAKQRHQQTTVECALQVCREEPHQDQRDAGKSQDDDQEQAGQI
jgi:hypothetical protein